MANKKIWLGILIIALVFGVTAVSCKDDPVNTNTTDSALNGTWASEDGYEIKLNNGSFEASTNGMEMIKGTYTTSGKNITMQATHVHSGMALTAADNIELPFAIPPIPPGWYTKTQLKLILKGGLGAYFELLGGDAIVDLMVDSIFEEETGTYSVSGNTLTMTIYNRTTTYTRV